MRSKKRAPGGKPRARPERNQSSGKLTAPHDSRNLTGCQVQIPSPFSELIDRVCDTDRKWFELHPDRNTRLRIHVPGEFWPWNPGRGMVYVFRVAPGVRIRRFVDLGGVS
jgi:hypothetical protein